jgi:hypothetical protein
MPMVNGRGELEERSMKMDPRQQGTRSAAQSVDACDDGVEKTESAAPTRRRRSYGYVGSAIGGTRAPLVA